MPNHFLSREAILGAADFETEEVNVPQWGGPVLVRTLSAKERDAFEAGLFKGEGKKRVMNLANLRARLVCRAVVNEDGGRVFADEDADLLGEKSAAAVDLIYGVAQRLNGLTDKDAEELVGKSKGTSDAD